MGIIRLIQEHTLRIPLTKLIEVHYFRTTTEMGGGERIRWGYDPDGEIAQRSANRDGSPLDIKLVDAPLTTVPKIEDLRLDLLSFIADRLKVYLRDRGARHDLVDAVFSLPGQDDLVLIVARVEALSGFLKTDDGANLLAAYKRAANILKIEEKKDGKPYTDEPEKGLLKEEAERELFEAVSLMQPAAAKAVEAEDFETAMGALAQLRAPLDAFFEGVTVNAEDKNLRANRLALLALIRRSMEQIADFSKIEG